MLAFVLSALLPAGGPVPAKAATATNVYAVSKRVIEVYGRPITSNSEAKLNIELGYGGPYVSLAFDREGNLFVADTDEVTIYHPPYSTPRSKGVTISRGIMFTENIALAFGRRGELFVVQRDSIAVFRPPFRASSMPSATIAAPNASGIAVDPAGNLFVARGTDHAVAIYRPPFTSTSTPSVLLSTRTTLENTAAGNDNPKSLAVDAAGNLYVGKPKSVLMFRPPFRASASPDVTLFTGIEPKCIAVDPDGSLYVSGGTPDSEEMKDVTIYDAPVRSSSTPSVELSMGEPTSIAFH